MYKIKKEEVIMTATIIILIILILVLGVIAGDIIYRQAIEIANLEEAITYQRLLREDAEKKLRSK